MKILHNFPDFILNLSSLLQSENPDFVKKTIELIKCYSDFEAVGLRFKESFDFPYYFADGFTGDFIKEENQLTILDDAGQLIYNSQNEPLLECMCGYVARGANKSLPFISEYGSFWTGSTSALLSAADKELLPDHMRFRCVKEGYESMVIIPIRVHNHNIGLLQLNDKRKDMVNSDIISDYESIAGILGIIYQRLEYEQSLKQKQFELEQALHKQRQEQLKRERSEKLFNLSFINSHVGMNICDLSGGYREVNRAFSQIVGFTKAGLLKMNFKEITHPDHLEQSLVLFEQMVAGKHDVINYEKKYLHKDGQVVWVNLNSTLIRDNLGTPLYIINHLEDITAKKEAENKLRIQREELEISQLKNKFFANLSHELKTPLNLIFSALQMIDIRKKELKNENILEKYLIILKQNGYRLLRLVNNLMDITKMDANVFNLNLQNINIVQLVEIIVKSVQDYIEHMDRNLIFITDIEDKVMACDAYQIERVLLNLLSNAVKFTDQGDQISVKIKQEEDNLVIIVKDTGIGIEKEKQKLIFQEFGQVDKSFTRNHEGSGLGLTIVKSIVEMHGGQISLQSEAGKGSEFIIELPICVISVKESSQIYNVESSINKVEVEFADIYQIE